MITYMQFIEGDISLSISEATIEDKVTIVMEDLENTEFLLHTIDLDLNSLIRLKKWLTEAIVTIESDHIKSEAP